MNAEALEEWLIQQVSEELEMDAEKIHTDKPLASYGLDSVAAVSISGDLELLLETKLDPTILFEYPTIDKMVDYLVIHHVNH